MRQISVLKSLCQILIQSDLSANIQLCSLHLVIPWTLITCTPDSCLSEVLLWRVIGGTFTFSFQHCISIPQNRIFFFLPFSLWFENVISATISGHGCLLFRYLSSCLSENLGWPLCSSSYDLLFWFNMGKISLIKSHFFTFNSFFLFLVTVIPSTHAEIHL